MQEGIIGRVDIGVRRLVSSRLLVALSRCGVLALIDFVAGGIFGSRGTGAERCVAVFGNVLVGLLGRTRGGLVDLVTDVVGGILDGIHCDRGLD